MEKGLNEAIKILINKSKTYNDGYLSSDELTLINSLIEDIDNKIESIPKCENCKNCLYDGDMHENLYCDYHDYNISGETVCCAYERVK